jgi:hypothetical protein
VLFSVFERAGTNIYALDSAQARGQPADPSMPISRLSVLPPLDPVDIFITAYLRDPTTGLPSGDFPVVPYRSRLALDYIGQPMIGVGATSYGTALGGSVAAYFGEMLGNRILGVGFQGYGELADFGGDVFYVNAERRWNWALSAGHFPYLTGFTQATQDPNTGDILYQQLRRRTFIDQASVTTQYPFSQSRRFELNVGATRVGYSTEVWQLITDAFGRPIDESRGDVPSPPAVAFGNATAAIVGDNSYFGFTSPIQGGRYRLEMGPTFGEINFTTVLADTRKYLFLRPLTVAFRAMTFGRYGPDSEDERLGELYVGQPTFIRGYDPNSFDVTECTITDDDECPEFNRLVGSRIAVGNIELRIPLFGSDQFGIYNWGFLPVEIAPFFDVGAAWTSGDKTEVRFDRATSDRVPVMSTGLTSRINLFGYIVGEIYYVYPLHRKAKGGHFGFQLAPGW